MTNTHSRQDVQIIRRALLSDGPAAMALSNLEQQFQRLEEQFDAVRRWHDIWKGLARKREEALWAIANEGVYWTGKDWSSVPAEMARAALAVSTPADVEGPETYSEAVSDSTPAKEQS